MAHTSLKTRTVWDLLLLAMDVAEEAAILLVETMALLEVAMVLVAHLAPAQEVVTVPALAEAVLKVCEALHLLVGTVLKAEVVPVPVLVLCLVR
jgi:hypothetical protein